MRFYIADPCPDQDLNAITPLSVRARSWLSRAIARLPEDDSISVIGAVTMLEGLDYHHDRFMDRVNRLNSYYTRVMGGEAWVDEGQSENEMSRLVPTSDERADLEALDHESVAYLNRLGQFHAHAKARGFVDKLTRTRQLMVFRNKHTAHRSIDAPRDETPAEQRGQAMAFGFYRLTRAGFPTYQMLSSRKHHDFHMQRDHPLVMQEALKAMTFTYLATM